ncbi:MAG: hypothetical protein AAGD07_24630 [Planctomycetota bacterium]
MKRNENMVGITRHVRVRHNRNNTTRVATGNNEPIVSLVGHVDERRIQDIAAQFPPYSHDRMNRLTEALIEEFGRATNQLEPVK